MLLCYVAGNSVNHSYQSKTRDLLVMFQKQNHAFLTYYSPYAVPGLITENVSLFANHHILSNKHLQQEDGKDGYILVKMDTCLSFLSLPPQLILSLDPQDSRSLRYP